MAGALCRDPAGSLHLIQIGYIPAENIETPNERLARLNRSRNVQYSSVQEVDESNQKPKTKNKSLMFHVYHEEITPDEYVIEASERFAEEETAELETPKGSINHKPDAASSPAASPVVEKKGFLKV